MEECQARVGGVTKTNEKKNELRRKQTSSRGGRYSSKKKEQRLFSGRNMQVILLEVNVVTL